ncbi:MAG: DUF4830 domain-containing protein [Peptostreptococcaceae bacterium]
MKGRIENMNKLKSSKTIIIVVSSIIVLIIAVLSLTNVNKSKEEYNLLKENLSSTKVSKDLIDKLKSTIKIDVYHDYHAESINNIKPVTITDEDIISDYLKLIQNITKNEYIDNDISGVSVKNQKLTFYTDKEKIEMNYSYDTLYNFGFIEYNEEKIDISYDFFRLITNTERYSPKTSSIPKDVETLFKKNNYKPSFLINKHKVLLPENLIYSPEKGIDEVYWAYNLALSKSVGLDFSNLLSKEVEAEVYYLLEEMPLFAYPVVDTSAVVLRYKGEIAGAYIDSGIVNRAIATIDGKSFEEAIGEELEDYLVKNHSDKNSELNKEISLLSHEEVIKKYYSSKKNKDVSTFLATLDIGYILNLLQSENGLLESELFNNLEKRDSVFKHVSKSEVLKFKEIDWDDKNEKSFNMDLNILESNDITINKGIYPMTVLMRVNENNTYKINSIGF